MRLAVAGIAATNSTVFVLRSDGAVFVLVRRGDYFSGKQNDGDPFWAAGPAVPGTEAAEEQEG